jgi:antitoxin HigA-1
MKRGMRHIHPGELLREEIVKEYGLTVTYAAKLLGVSRVTLSNLLNEKADLTAEMAFRLATVFGGSAESWVNLQMKFNMHKAEQKVKLLKLQPYRPGKAI